MLMGGSYQSHIDIPMQLLLCLKSNKMKAPFYLGLEKAFMNKKTTTGSGNNTVIQKNKQETLSVYIYFLGTYSLKYTLTLCHFIN